MTDYMLVVHFTSDGDGVPEAFSNIVESIAPFMVDNVEVSLAEPLP